MNITDVLDIKSIAIGLDVKSKEKLFDEMVVLASKSGNIINKEEVLLEIMKREAIMSTGIGNGIALPHAKTNAVNDTICALAILANPIEYDAIDGNPVTIVLLLLGKENNVGIHLRLLSRISRILGNKDILEQIKNSTSAEEVYSILSESDEK